MYKIPQEKAGIDSCSCIRIIICTGRFIV